MVRFSNDQCPRVRLVQGYLKKFWPTKSSNIRLRKCAKTFKKCKKYQNFEKNLKNGRTLANRSSADYVGVFWLEVDLEPAGPDLDADIKSGTVGQPVCRKMPKNLNFTTSKKRFFGIFRRTGRPIFKPIFSGERSSQGLQKRSLQPCCYNAPFGRYFVFRFFLSGFLLP